MILILSAVQVEVAHNGLPPLLVDLLKQHKALTILNLLAVVRVIYQHHPRPKEFIVKFNIAEQLRQLVASNNSQVLVRTKAQELLDAFQMNSVF